MHTANNMRRYATFAERPFALLEVKPAPMLHAWFRKYHVSAFVLDTWVYAFEAGEREHRGTIAAGNSPAHHGAILPLAVFREFAQSVVRRFDRWATQRRAQEGLS
uniref:Uncharacterized protein n=1 Tax=Haptolina brevifila TaxID=156173 RepID=A0A7S2GD24_9EUKA|mmetsp:Transcript_33145/g.65937  ORF Transcript_33145/g.65937 Transcript_33145/m.65937 type:complete len:105 (+) Transcript_33145:366-680(+)